MILVFRITFEFGMRHTWAVDYPRDVNGANVRYW